MLEKPARVVAVVPARGGSLGLPGKNLARVGGMPLVERAVRTALAVDEIDAVVVSTDDDEIAGVARTAGARIVERPPELAGGTASSESALLHALDAIRAELGEPAVTVFVQATSPFIDAADLADAVRRVRGGERDVVFSATESHAFLWRSTPLGATGVNHDAAFRARRQDREPELRETGAFYVLDTAGFRAARHRFFGRIGVQLVPAEHAVEIDDAVDLAIARAIAGIADGVPGAADAASAARGDAAFAGGAAAPGIRPEPLDGPTPRRRTAGRAPDIDVDAVVTDFDGVHTDDTAFVDEHGRESVRVSRSDGQGVRRLREAGLPVLILSAETNPVVGARAAKLGVEVEQGVADKGAALRAWAARTGVRLERIAYLGNDLGDLPALRLAGWPVAVADAAPGARAIARHVLRRAGGNGAVRELAELVLAARARRAEARAHHDPAASTDAGTLDPSGATP